MLTQEALKKRLKYEPDTGAFIWINTNSYRFKNGSVAGTLNSTGYWVIILDRKQYLAHRLAFLYMNGEMPTHQVDHIDHNKTNNKYSNLRLVTNSENSKNLKLDKRNKTGVSGVQFRKKYGIFIARINVDKKDIYLGSFKNFDDAVLAREKASIKYGFHFNHGTP
jgi:hypothetical protein